MKTPAKKTTLAFGLAGALLCLGATGAHSEEQTSTADSLIEQLRSSADPLQTLDSMSQKHQEVILEALSKLNAEEQEALFPEMATRAARAGGYTDIAWSFLEKAACVVHVDLVSCNKAAADANTASKSAEQLFPAASLHNGKGDAYRHCYWNALMTISIGESGAMKIASNHEAVRGGPANEKNMDLANNKTGRAVGKVQKTAAKSSAQCRTLANQGKLVTLK